MNFTNFSLAMIVIATAINVWNSTRFKAVEEQLSDLLNKNTLLNEKFKNLSERGEKTLTNLAYLEQIVDRINNECKENFKNKENSCKKGNKKKQ